MVGQPHVEAVTSSPAQITAVALAVEVGPPLGLLTELTQRCPLQCPYCSNPVNLLKANEEMSTADWLSVFDQAADMGVLQVHLSGGEPTLRTDLEQLIAKLAERGIYSNLITAGVGVSRDRLKAFADLGLNHVQLSIQSVRPAMIDKITNYKDALAKKTAFAHWVRELDLPLTINAVIHRHNIDETEEVIQYALDVGAERLEVANTQYYGWAALNRAALMPTYKQVIRQAGVVAEARVKLKGILNFDYVPTDYYAEYPKPCMGGWANDVLDIMANGKVLPCHAAESLPQVHAENVREKPLADIWYRSESFNLYRGTDWMLEPCTSCERKTVDFGGCRCQALALTGDARNADPACQKSPHHRSMKAMAEDAAASGPPEFQYRRIGRTSYI